MADVHGHFNAQAPSSGVQLCPEVQLEPSERQNKTDEERTGEGKFKRS